MNVYSLITIPPNHNEHNCTLFLETIRDGFPDAYIRLYLNEDLQPTSRIAHYSTMYDLDLITDFGRLTYHEWIHDRIKENKWRNEPYVIVDPDTIWWKKFDPSGINQSLAGYHVPCHINSFSKCLYMSRLHTSLLYIRSGAELVDALDHGPQAWDTRIMDDPRISDYAPRSRIGPQTIYIYGKRIYYDTMSCPYHAIGGYTFTDTQLSCYDHINSASFYNVMVEKCLDPEDVFSYHNVHHLAEHDPVKLRGLHHSITKYYQKTAISLHDYLYLNPSPSRPL